MSKVIKIDKDIILHFQDRMINLPENIQKEIEIFWNKAVMENPNLYNGQDFGIESIKETEKSIEIQVVKTCYAHYLYDERIGINEEQYKCNSPFGAVLLLTKDDYFVVGEMNSTTSFPHGLQLPGGGIDVKDIKGDIIDIESNINRELNEELNLTLNMLDYKIEFISIPNKESNSCGIFAIGIIEMTKEELKHHFEEYKKYLIKNNLEVELIDIVFLKKQDAVQQLDAINKNKRPYLRNLIIEAMKL